MNIYVRYFDHENVFSSAEEVIGFLEELNDFSMTPQLRHEITSYHTSNMPYSKRVAVKGKNYFILIKTTAATLPEFKAKGKDQQGDDAKSENKRAKDARYDELHEERTGWYKADIQFNRVVTIPGTQKCSYRNTLFSAYVYATSPIDCYNQVIDHLSNRSDVDPRSQFPSEKKNKFAYEFIGENIPKTSTSI